MKLERGFTLIEMVITVVIISILALIAYPSYMSSITKTKRRAAEACLSTYATQMERFYTTNLRYDQDPTGTKISLPTPDCALTTNSGKDYTFTLSSVTQSTYTLQAQPISGSTQQAQDTLCGTLTLDNTGTRGPTPSQCW